MFGVLFKPRGSQSLSDFVQVFTVPSIKQVPNKILDALVYSSFLPIAQMTKEVSKGEEHQREESARLVQAYLNWHLQSKAGIIPFLLQAERLRCRPVKALAREYSTNK